MSLNILPENCLRLISRSLTLLKIILLKRTCHRFNKFVKIKVDSKSDDKESYKNFHKFTCSSGLFILDTIYYNSIEDREKYFIYASERGHLKIIKYLLNCNELANGSKRIDPTIDDNRSIQLASKEGQHEIVQILLNYNPPKDFKRVNPSANDNFAIGIASLNGHDKVVKLLLDYESNNNLFWWKKSSGKKFDPTFDINTAFIYACEYGHIKVVKLLLNYEPNNGTRKVSGSINEAIELASQYGHLKVIEYLLDYDDSDYFYEIDPSDNDNWAIRIASEYGRFEVVEFLLKDPRVNPKNLSDQEFFEQYLEVDLWISRI